MERTDEIKRCYEMALDHLHEIDRIHYYGWPDPGQTCEKQNERDMTLWLGKARFLEGWGGQGGGGLSTGTLCRK